jgi:hypothetical protein
MVGSLSQGNISEKKASTKNTLHFLYKIGEIQVCVVQTSTAKIFYLEKMKKLTVDEYFKAVETTLALDQEIKTELYKKHSVKCLGI